MKKKQRIEITITQADVDIEQFLNATDTPNATMFKIAMRAYMKQQDDEQLDMKIKRLLDEAFSKFAKTITVLDNQALTPPTQALSEKKRLGFTAKKI